MNYSDKQGFAYFVKHISLLKDRTSLLENFDEPVRLRVDKMNSFFFVSAARGKSSTIWIYKFLVKKYLKRIQAYGDFIHLDKKSRYVFNSGLLNKCIK